MEQCLLDYAKMCSDELAVYNYMEENNLGTNNPVYWLAIAKYHEKMRDFAKVM